MVLVLQRRRIVREGPTLPGGVAAGETTPPALLPGQQHTHIIRQLNLYLVLLRRRIVREGAALAGSALEVVHPPGRPSSVRRTPLALVVEEAFSFAVAHAAGGHTLNHRNRLPRERFLCLWTIRGVRGRDYMGDSAVPGTFFVPVDNMLWCSRTRLYGTTTSPCSR